MILHIREEELHILGLVVLHIKEEVVFTLDGT